MNITAEKNMTRPSKNVDRLLIQAAKELIPKTGFAGLKVRIVAKKAGVNPGMFIYHFQTKDKFIEVLIAEVYNDFFKNFSLEAGNGATGIEKLRNVLLSVAFFLRDNQTLVSPFVQEILTGNKEIVKFARNNMLRHIPVLIRLIKECQKEGFIIKAPLFTVLSFLMPAVAGPVVMIGTLRKYTGTGILPGIFEGVVKKQILSNAVIKQRVDMLLKGLRP